MSSDGAKLQCYNRCCGMTFDPITNMEDSCKHHPGVPVFHDAYKKWSCCDRKTTDFTEFLNFIGCTKSYHSNVKPPEPPKPSTNEHLDIKEVPKMPKPLEQKVAIVRPNHNVRMITLHFSVGSSLKPLLEKMMKENTIKTEIANDATVQLNTPCHNKGCRATFKGEQSNEETCLHHSGNPIFHEGMKYWSCCVKRTTDFDSFLDQVGCTPGKHKWHKEKNLENQTKCRYDWHQTGGFVIVSVYSKCPLPDLSLVEANPVKLKMEITFGKDKSIFEEELHLFGVIDLDGSTVTYLGSKVEVKLKKAEALSWKTLATKNILSGIHAMTIQDK